MTLIKQLRERLGWSQEKFAKRIGKSFSSLRGYESGRRPPLSVLAIMLSLTSQNGFSDIADQIEIQAEEILKPLRRQEMVASGQVIDVELYHSLLDEILGSPDESAVLAVRHILVVYADMLRPRKGTGAVPKRGDAEA